MFSKSVPTRRRPSRFAAEWLVLLALVAVAVVATVGALAEQRRSLLDAEVERLQGQGRVVAENLAQRLAGADRALAGVAATVVGEGGRAEPAAVTDQLRLLTAAMPGFASMLWLGPDGTVLAAAWPGLAGRNFASRDYFDAPRRSGDAARLFVSPPFQATYAGSLVVASKAVVAADGRFAGVVTATLDPAYFAVLLESVRYAPDLRAAVLHGGGAVFVAVPPRGDGAAPSASGGGDGAPDAGGERLVVRRPVPETPLSVMLSRDLAPILSPWYAHTLQDLALLAVVVVIGCASLAFDQRRRDDARRALDAAGRERQAAAERLEQALRGADLGLWELHVPTDTFVISARERAILGYAPGDPLPQGPAWRKQVHPDDRARVDAAILPHLKGDAPAYDCEHRMRHRDGHHVWVSSRAMIVERDAAGAPVRIVGTHLDITARKAAEAQLARANARLRDRERELRLLTDHVPALISRIDASQRFTFANRAYADWLGREPSSLVGRTLRDVYGEAVHEGVRAHIECALAGVEVCYERDLDTPTGQRRVEFTLVPDVDADGRPDGYYALAVDITARHAAERLQAQSEERLSIALEGSGHVLFDWNLVTHTVFQSAAAGAIRGEAAVAGERSIESMQRDVHPDDLAALMASARGAITGRTPIYEADFRVRRVDGEWVWIRARGRVVERDAGGRALRITGTYADVSDRKREEGRLRRLAEFDTLTGLPNRALFRDRLQQAMVRARRGRPMALLFVDVDHFKGINDTFGHEAGDEVLKVFAHRMQATVRASDTVARLGGDEFTVILEGIRGPEDASTIAGKLNEALEAPIALRDGDDLAVTASIGIAIDVRGEGDETVLLRRADAALYEAKRRGRNSHFCAELDA